MDASEASLWNAAITASAALLGAVVGAAGALVVERSRRREERLQRLADGQKTSYEDFLRACERVRIAMLVPDVAAALDFMRAAREHLSSMALITSREVIRSATNHLSALTELVGAVDTLEKAHARGVATEIETAATIADQRLAALAGTEGVLVDAMRRHLGLTDLLPMEDGRGPNADQQSGGG